MRTERSIDSEVFALTAQGPRLLGARCRECGTSTFPVQDGCPRCTATSMDAVELDRRGTLWAWTIQGFPPKAPPYIGEVDPARFEPFGVGYVELPDEVKVEARLTEHDPSRLHLGMEMELVVLPLAEDDDGSSIVTFAFAPVPQDVPS